ncbi:restriction endonuclease subunit S [Pseudomonas sp. W2Jun17]|uniref:restriction endonuclease subunit S n=1 Tax=Pseudomonas sp. W2Jun17 TaxID=1553460 RepID=UPI002006B485|nr:restriction endonuclease subunit S [Pseudomonas sp. W2Jun17]MCK3849091.1 restriction endonuclease subunit S [Pseudomonas sp. W2Jun17]
MSFPAYPDYKHSGVEWANELPAHWRTVALKWVSRIYAGGTPDKNKTYYWENGSIPWLNSGAVNQVLISEPSSYITTEAFSSSSARWIPAGSLVIALAGQGKTKGMVAQLAIKTTCNQSMAAIVPDLSMVSRYLFWWLSSNYQNIRNMAGGDHRDGLNLELIGNIAALLPTEAEQTQIARFLDHETARIDALIEEQQRLIELLKEKRQAVISHAVTKGLDPTVPMKDSGVEWLGEVPAHWVVSKFGYISSVVRGGSPRPAGDPELFNGDFSPWVTVAEITKDDEIYLEETETFLTKKGSDQCRIFSKGTLLLSNSGATLGVPKILMINANANDGVVGFENISLDREYSYFYLSTLTQGLRKRAAGSGQPNLNTDIVKSIDVPIPPSNEVAEILVAVRKLRAQFHLLSKEAADGVRLLQERRSALISAAVTGKIDVRGWQPPVSTQAPKSEAAEAV